MRDIAKRTVDKHRNMSNLRACVRLLYSLEEDLLHVGLTFPARRVARILMLLTPTLDDLDKIHGEDVQDALFQSQQASDNMLKACLSTLEKQ